MRFHLALAGLALLISPFATVAEHQPGHSGGTDMTKDDKMPASGQKKGLGAGNLQRALDAIAKFEELKVVSPAGRRLADIPGSEFIEGNVCGTTITRLNNPCGPVGDSGTFQPAPDILEFNLVAGTLYTFKVHHLTCGLDPTSLLLKKMGGDEPALKEAKSNFIKRPSVCGTAGEVLDPEIVFEVKKNDAFYFITGPYIFPDCPAEGYGYEIEISCIPEAAPGA
jgi:hypothetical protein